MLLTAKPVLCRQSLGTRKNGHLKQVAVKLRCIDCKNANVGNKNDGLLRFMAAK